MTGPDLEKTDDPLPLDQIILTRPPNITLTDRFEATNIVIGVGGTASVRIGIDKLSGGPVAIKEILPERHVHPYYRERFRCEASVGCYLTGIRGVVPILTVGVQPTEHLFIVMPLIARYDPEKWSSFIRDPHGNDFPVTPAYDLGDAIIELWKIQDREEKAVKLREIVRHIVTVSETIQCVHERRILHLDLKPENILISPFDDTALIGDWGTSACLKNEVVESGESKKVDWTLATPFRPVFVERATQGAIGTSAFMSPELARNEPDNIGIATDVYLLGSTMYTVLAGVAPFGSADEKESLLFAQQGVPVKARPSHLSPREARLWDVVEVAMSIDPRQRFNSAAAFGKQLERALIE